MPGKAESKKPRLGPLARLRPAVRRLAATLKRLEMDAFRKMFGSCVNTQPQLKPQVKRPIRTSNSEAISAAYAQKRARPPSATVATPGATRDMKSPEAGVHLTLVIDSSEDMQGRPLAAVTRGIQFLLRFLQPRDLLTIYLFDTSVFRPLHCEVQHFKGQLGDQKSRRNAGSPEDRVWLYDAIVTAVEDIESQGLRPSVVKPLLVLTDIHRLYGAAEAFDAKNALLWCEVPSVYPILVSAGDPDVYDDIRQTKTREVYVQGTEDAEIRKAFQVAGEHLQAILKSCPVQDSGVELTAPLTKSRQSSCEDMSIGQQEAALEETDNDHIHIEMVDTMDTQDSGIMHTC